MLSHVKRRFIHQSLLTSKILEKSFVCPTSRQLSSSRKKGKDGDDDESGGDDSLFSGGVSRPMKQLLSPAPENVVKKLKMLSKESSTDNSSLFDDVFKQTSGQKNLTFKRGKKPKPSIKPSQMKPELYNEELISAAIKVASKAGNAEAEVKDDLLEKISATFHGIKNPNREKSGRDSRKKSMGKPKNDRDPYQLEQVLQKPPPTKSFKGPSQSEPFTDDLTSLVSELDKIETPSATPKEKGVGFWGELKFSSAEEFVKSQTPLNIFPEKFAQESYDSCLQMWEAFEAAEIRRATRFEPLNWFDQCVQWTEDGKLWKFPIDNEQGMEEESKIDFTQHIFLDHHIESWCPKEGPICHFMELIVVGLSKNPYYSVSEKKEILEWYRQYFMKHKNLLEEIEAFGSPQNPIQIEGKISEGA